MLRLSRNIVMINQIISVFSKYYPYDTTLIYQKVIILLIIYSNSKLMVIDLVINIQKLNMYKIYLPILFNASGKLGSYLKESA